MEGVPTKILGRATFIQGKIYFAGVISMDSGIDREHLANTISDRYVWNKIVQSIPTERAESRR